MEVIHFENIKLDSNNFDLKQAPDFSSACFLTYYKKVSYSRVVLGFLVSSNNSAVDCVQRVATCIQVLRSAMSA